MENESNVLQKIKTLTCVKPISLQYLTDDTIIVRQKGIPHQCSIVDTKKDQIIKNFPYSVFKIDQTRKKIAFSYEKNVKIYSLQTDRYEWSKEEKYHIHDINFDVNGDIFLSLYNPEIIRNMIKKYDHDDTFEKIYCIAQILARIAFNVRKQYICVADQYKLHIYKLAHRTVANEKILDLPIRAHCCQTSFNNLVAVHNGAEIIIRNLNNCHLKEVSIKADKNEMFVYIQFYLDSPILVTRSLLNDRNIIRYWDTITQQIIDTTSFITTNKIMSTFTFSPNGKEIAIVCDDECFTGHVPFEVIYKAGIKEKSISFLWILQEYAIKQKQHQNISLDIIKLLIDTYLELCKR